MASPGQREEGDLLWSGQFLLMTRVGEGTVLGQRERLDCSRHTHLQMADLRLGLGLRGGRKTPCPAHGRPRVPPSALHKNKEINKGVHLQLIFF